MENTTQQRTNKLKKIDFSQQSFMANGKEYFIDDSMAIVRYAEFQALSPELGYGLGVAEMYKKIIEIEKHMNKSEFVKASVALNDFANGVKAVGDRLHTAIKLCCLFINTADEDITVIDPKVMENKVNDWKKEGIDMKCFFTLAINIMGGYIDIYNRVTGIFSEEQSEN